MGCILDSIETPLDFDDLRVLNTRYSPLHLLGGKKNKEKLLGIAHLGFDYVISVDNDLVLDTPMINAPFIMLFHITDSDFFKTFAKVFEQEKVPTEEGKRLEVTVYVQRHFILHFIENSCYQFD